MPSADDPQQTTWQWADVDGSRHSASLDELSRLLESGALPPLTLVWKAGWSEWLEARECELLVDRIPAAQRKPTRSPRTDSAHAELPPEPPLERYESAQKQSALRALLGTSSAPPPPPPSSPTPSSGAGSSAAALIGRAASSSQAPPPPPGERPSSPPSERRAPIPSAPHITPPPADIQIKTLPDLDHAEELDAEPEEDSSAHASPEELDPEELESEIGGSSPIPEVTPDEEHEELEPDELESDIATEPPEERAEESRRKVASAAALIGAGSSSATPPPPASARPSTPPTSKPAPASAAALLTSGAASVPGPRASRPPSAGAMPASGPVSGGPPSGPPMSAPAPAAVAAQPGGGLTNSNIILGALVIGLLAVVVILLMNQRSTGGSSTEVVVSGPQTSKSGDTTQSKGGAPPRSPCKVSVEPRKLLDSAYLGVAPRAISISAEKVTLGLAKDSKRALGIDVALADLSVEQAFEERAAGRVVAVTPTPDHRFLVTHDRQKRDGAVEYSPGMTIGARGKQFEVVRAGEPHELGTLPSEEVTTPSIERAQDQAKSYAVVLRSGGQEGKLVFGWLDGQGQLKGTLGAVSMQDAFLGTPSVTTSDTSALITVATRASADAYWGITLASAALHQPPKSSKSFTPPAGGPGGEAISPAASALSQGRWVLMWTEGPRGKHEVRAQTLDADLIPSGPAVRLSAAGSDAGQGTVIATGDRALAVFFVRTPAGAELWGTGLSCQ